MLNKLIAVFFPEMAAVAPSVGLWSVTRISSSAFRARGRPSASSPSGKRWRAGARARYGKDTRQHVRRPGLGNTEVANPPKDSFEAALGGAGAKLPEASVPDILGAFRASGLDLQKSMAGAVHWIDEAEEVTGQGVHVDARRKEDRRFRGMLIVTIIGVLIGVVGWIF